MIPIAFILVAIAGASKGVMDTLQFHFDRSLWFSAEINGFWNPEYSWSNKYEPLVTDQTPLVRKKWFGVIPVPVFLTDGWHLFQSIMLTSIFVAMVLCIKLKVVEFDYFKMICSFILLRGTFGLFFVLFYNYILIKK